MTRKPTTKDLKEFARRIEALPEPQRSMAKAHWAKTLKEEENRRRLERNREELIDLQSRARPTPQPPEDDDENLNNHPIEAQEGPAQKPTRPRAELKHGTNPA